MGAASNLLEEPATRLDPLREEVRAAMRELAGAVSIVSAGRGEYRAGLVATSVSPLSSDPPTLVVCVDRASSSWPVLRQAKSFGVNLLSASQRELAHCFAERTGLAAAERYQEGDWTALQTGAPIFGDALAAFDCSLEEIIERHSHALLIGRIEAVSRRGGAGALLHWRGAYEQLGWSLEEISNAVGLAPAARKNISLTARRV